MAYLVATLPNVFGLARTLTLWIPNHSRQPMLLDYIKVAVRLLNGGITIFLRIYDNQSEQA
jgi:hypothetical protein